MELKACCKERFEPVVQAIRKLQKEKEGLDEPLIVAIDGRRRPLILWIPQAVSFPLRS